MISRRAGRVASIAERVRHVAWRQRPKSRASFSGFSSNDELNGPFQDVKAFRTVMSVRLGPTVKYG